MFLRHMSTRQVMPRHIGLSVSYKNFRCHWAVSGKNFPLRQVSALGQNFKRHMSTSKPPDWPYDGLKNDKKSSKDGKIEIPGSDIVDKIMEEKRLNMNENNIEKRLNMTENNMETPGKNENNMEASEKTQKSMETIEKNDSGFSNSGKMDRWIDYLQEKKPEVYNLGQKITEKSISLKNSVVAKIEDKINDEKKPEDWNDILNRWYIQYQDFVGITDLKKAQDRVTELSETLMETEGRRRSLQVETEELQDRLVSNHQRITKTEQYSPEHVALFDQAREINERLKIVRAEFIHCEKTERDTLTQLSAAIRDCHERERVQTEQSKYWSIIASVVSAALASIITTGNNWVRIREIKDHVSSNNKNLIEGYKKMHEDVLNTISSAISINGTREIVDNLGNTVIVGNRMNSSEFMNGNTVNTRDFVNENTEIVKNGGINAKIGDKSLISVNENKEIVKNGEMIIKSTEINKEMGEKSIEISEKNIGDGFSKSTVEKSNIHEKLTLGSDEILQLSRNIFKETSDALAKNREQIRVVLAEELGKIVSEMVSRGELVSRDGKIGGIEMSRGELGSMEGKIEVSSELGSREGEIGMSRDKTARETPQTAEPELEAQYLDTLETAKALGSAIALDSSIPGSSEASKGPSEYTYRHIGSAMAVGAGLGTLATACIMRSLGG